MLYLVTTISDLFLDLGAGIAGSTDVYGFIIIIAIMFLLLMLNMPYPMVMISMGLLITALSLWGGIFSSLLAIVGTIFGAILGIFIWAISNKGK